MYKRHAVLRQVQSDVPELNRTDTI